MEPCTFYMLNKLIDGIAEFLASIPFKAKHCISDIKTNNILPKPKIYLKELYPQSFLHIEMIVQKCWLYSPITCSQASLSTTSHCIVSKLGCKGHNFKALYHAVSTSRISTELILICTFDKTHEHNFKTHTGKAILKK